MSYLLTDPDVALLVGGTASVHDEVTTAVRDAVADVVRVDSPAAATEALADRDDVGCVVVLDGGTFEDAVAAAREADFGGRLPVVAYVEPDEAVARVAAATEGCRYLPRPDDGPVGTRGDDETATEHDDGAAAERSSDRVDLRAVVTDALAAYQRRRDEAADSDILDIYLSEIDVSMFAKDDKGRFVRDLRSTDPSDGFSTIGKTDREAHGATQPRAAESSYRDDLEVIETGEPIRKKRERWGSKYWSEATKVPWRIDGETVGLVGLALNVTREVELERQLAEQNRRFEQFASYVSHDLRTPLQVAFGAVDRARDGDDEALDKLEESLDRIEEIIADLRRLTEEDVDPESSDIVAEAHSTVESTRLASLVEKIWRVTAPSNATLEVDLPEGTVVVVESEILRPLVKNIMKNAIDHGGEDVTVRVGLTDARGFFVEDDGPGIPPGERERVLQQGYTTAEDGSGTGLAIVQETAIRQNWGVSIETSRLETPSASGAANTGASDGEAMDADESDDVVVADQAEDDAVVTDEADDVAAVTDEADDVAAVTDGFADEAWRRGTRITVSNCPVVVPVEVSAGESLSLSDATDVGDVAVDGNADYEAESDRWTVSGAGEDLWGDIDEFHLVSAAVEGPVRVQARVESLDAADDYSKAGVTVRAGLAEGDTYLYVGESGDHGSEVIQRELPDRPAASRQFEEPPGAYDWYRIDRVGDTVTAFFSSDGEQFYPVDQRSISLDDPVRVGLAVCSHVPGQDCEATFTDVEVRELHLDDG